MKTNRELMVINRFLKTNYPNAWGLAVLANARADRAQWFSLLAGFSGYAVALVGVVINNITSLEWSEGIGKVLFILAGAMIVFFWSRFFMKMSAVAKFCDFPRTSEPATECYKSEVAWFKKYFGKRPDQLGPVGVAKRLTKIAKKVLRYVEMKDSSGEYQWRRRLQCAYDSAKKFMPVNSYEQIFSAAERGAKRPTFVPELR